MKTPFHHRTHGFTLIELLVVISIIAVLAAAGFAGVTAAIEKARKVTCLSTATAIESAVNNFYTEYGTMPQDGNQDDTLETNTDIDFLNVLLGQEGTGQDVLNTRSIRFLTVREGKGRKNGIIYDAGGTTVQGLYDPWGGSFKVALDMDYDERLTVSPKGGSEETLNGRRVAVWSDGADGVDEDGKPKDDVKTWGK